MAIPDSSAILPKPYDAREAYENDVKCSLRTSWPQGYHNPGRPQPQHSPPWGMRPSEYICRSTEHAMLGTAQDLREPAVRSGCHGGANARPDHNE